MQGAAARCPEPHAASGIGQNLPCPKQQQLSCDVAEDELRGELKAAARRLGEASKYRSAGTIEFLVDQDTAKFYFLEVNTRLQARSCTRPPALCAQSWRGVALVQPWQA